jgi:hypothetical protein
LDEDFCCLWVGYGERVSQTAPSLVHIFAQTHPKIRFLCFLYFVLHRAFTVPPLWRQCSSWLFQLSLQHNNSKWLLLIQITIQFVARINY